MNEFLDTYGPYLNDAWRRTYRVALVFVASFFVGLLFAGTFVRAITEWFGMPGINIVLSSPFQLVGLFVDVGIFVAICVSVPYAVYQLYAFLRPGLSWKESRGFLLVLPVSVLLFAAGFVYGFGSLYWGLGALATLATTYGLQNMWDIETLIAQITMTAMLLGTLFQFPLVLSLLVRACILDRATLVRHRRTAHAGILIIVALLPPTDGFTLMLMVLPLAAMYELTILLSYSLLMSTPQGDAATLNNGHR